MGPEGCLIAGRGCWAWLELWAHGHSPPSEKERELCVRERLAEDKLTRAEGLLRTCSALRALACGTGGCGWGGGTCLQDPGVA